MYMEYFDNELTQVFCSCSRCSFCIVVVCMYTKRGICRYIYIYKEV